MSMTGKAVSLMALSVLLVLAVVAGSAEAFLFAGSSGTLAASVDFSQSGTDLIVTLTNTSLTDVNAPGFVLTAVFFDLAGVGALTPVSAVLDLGSLVVYDLDGQPAGGVVGGEWAYGSGLAGAPGGATEGISSSGFGLFGAANFPGPDLAGPPCPPSCAVDGVQYGILPAGWLAAGDNGGLTGSGGLIKNQVVFDLSGLPAGFTLQASYISHVEFQYGTGLDETHFGGTIGGTTNTGVPEPASVVLLGTGLLGLAGVAGLRHWLGRK